MKLQEELMQLVEDYKTKKYHKWLSDNLDFIKGIKAQMFDNASNGLLSIETNVVLSEDGKYYLEKWLSEAGLAYTLTSEDYQKSTPIKYNLYATWWK